LKVLIENEDIKEKMTINYSQVTNLIKILKTKKYLNLNDMDI